MIILPVGVELGVTHGLQSCASMGTHEYTSTPPNLGRVDQVAQQLFGRAGAVRSPCRVPLNCKLEAYRGWVPVER